MVAKVIRSEIKRLQHESPTRQCGDGFRSFLHTEYLQSGRRAERAGGRPRPINRKDLNDPRTACGGLRSYGALVAKVSGKL